MGIIVLLISISLVIAVGFLIAFLWSVNRGQYDDTYSPSVRMLFEDRIKDKNLKIIKNGNQSTPGSIIKKV